MSGGGIVVRHFTVDQEVMGTNFTNNRHSFQSCARSQGLLSQFCKKGSDCRYGGPAHKAETIRVNGSMSYADRLWSVIAPTFDLKPISDVLDTNSTYTNIMFAHLPHLLHLPHYIDWE